MKKTYILISLMIILFFIYLSCPTAGSGGGGVDTPAKWSSQLKNISPDPENNDSLGYSVSISGDYAIVGTRTKDNGRGAAYIFHRTGTNTWDQGFKITASDASDGDCFGNSVSISGNYAIVGAFQEDGAGSDRGAAYIFYRTGINVWEERSKIKASDGADNDYFGISVSISGNFAIVGASNQDCGGTNRGAAYIFNRVIDAWDMMTKITASDVVDHDSFGISVSISGNYAVVGAYHKDDGGIDRGAAYIFHRLTLIDTWVQDNKITASDTEDNDWFGFSVSMSGDYVIVGANWEDGGGTNRGAAYIFHRTGSSTFDSGVKVIAPISSDNDYFGGSVSISGDHAIIGATKADGSGTDKGTAYIFQRTGENTWDNGFRITASDAEDYDNFGNSVSISGDYAIVGAHMEDGSGTDRGAAYIFK